MIQDIYPQKLNNAYTHKKVSPNSVIFSFKGDTALCGGDNEIRFPLYDNIEAADHECIYLFEIGGTDFFLTLKENIKTPPGFAYRGVNIFRTMRPRRLAFAGMTAYHLFNWYRDNTYCGRCGHILGHSIKERALTCEKCANCIYPRIAPVVIVGVVNGNQLLMTKNANREYQRYGLIAGFIEVGEDAEEAVKREVMEEVGVKVKNINYYKSQPWGFSGSLLLGYYAELDGGPDLTVEENELSEAVWLEREDIPAEPDHFSLTNELICRFKDDRRFL